MASAHNIPPRFVLGFSGWRSVLDAAPVTERLAAFNSAVVEVAGFVTNQGLDRVIATDELSDIAASYALDTDAAQNIIAKTFEKIRPIREPKANGHDTQPLLVPSGQFVRRFKSPEYLITGILQRRFLYSLTGRTGSGKTAIALLFAASVALGRPIGDIRVKQGRVIYLAGENPDDILYRWIAMGQQFDFNVDTIPVAFIPGRFRISQLRQRILAEAKNWGPVALVIVDTSAAYYEGTEVNSNTEMATHAAMMRGLIDIEGGPTVVVNCHPVKHAANDNLLPLGAGAFLNEVDGNLTCVVDYPAVEVHWQGKFRGPDFEALTFRLDTVTHEQLKDTDGNTIPTVVAKHLSETAREEIAKANLTDRQRLVAEIEADGKATVREYAARCGFKGTRKTQTLITKLKKDRLIEGEPGDYRIKTKLRRKDSKSETKSETERDLLDNIVSLPKQRETRKPKNEVDD